LRREEFWIQADGAKLKGYIVYDESDGLGKRPLIMTCPSVCGMTSFDFDVADRLAASGYVGMVLDTYGDGWGTENMDRDRNEAFLRMNRLVQNRAAFRRRLLPFLEYGRKHPQVDASKTGAIGYCYGGTALLELVRSGSGISGVCGFHSYAIAAHPLGPVRAGNPSRVLLLHANDDPVCKADEVMAFMGEFSAAKVDFQVNFYGNCSHGFAHPINGGQSYDPKWERRSWRDMMAFFQELFSSETLASAIGHQSRSSARSYQTAHQEAINENKWACCVPPDDSSL
jgi:dienelactone hydrolase